MEQTETTAQPAEHQQEPPSVNIQDLQVLRSCIQLACTRGAFRAEEMHTVGTAFNRLDAFLKHVENAQPQELEQASATEPTQGE
jgi:hypothetical protein